MLVQYLQNKFPALEQLYPGYFSLVMATGIVSIAAHLANWAELSWFLFQLNMFFYLALWILYGLRIVAFPRRVFEDFINHTRGPAFFPLLPVRVSWGASLPS